MTESECIILHISSAGRQKMFVLQMVSDFFPSYFVFQFLFVCFFQDGRVGREVKGVCVCMCV